jgi:lia operon protein LiaG
MALTLLALACACSTLRAQDYKVTVDNTKDAKLTLENFPGDLPVEGYAGNEIVLSGSGDFTTPERAKGLKPVYAGGSDNTGVAVAADKDGNKITLRCLLPITQNGTYKLRVPENIALKIIRECSRNGDVTISNMKSEIEVKNCGSVTLKKVSGPLVISTISGPINVVFTDISKDKPINLAAISGDIDVTLPAKAAVDLEMSAISGNMYTDFDLSTDKQDMHRVGGGTIHSTLNGGGTELKIHVVSSNIYLRKG